MSAGHVFLAKQLPYLRRFARAVHGRQESGDRLVLDTIKTLQPDQLENEPAALRRSLFRALVDACKSAPAATSLGGTIADERILAARIRALPPPASLALLLVALEGFSIEDVAFILRSTTDETARQLEQAQAELDAQPPTSILIIEDEPVIALDIEGVVRQAGHSVVGIATTRAQAVALARERRPGLVLADIQLDSPTAGIRAVDQILAELPVPVIFVTAYPERLLTGERPEPSFLVTKPFNERLLRVAIAQALRDRPDLAA